MKYSWVKFGNRCLTPFPDPVSGRAGRLRSNCILDTTKLLVAGVQMRTVDEAFESALQHWKVAVE